MLARLQERGFALAGAIFAMVVIAALIAGAFFAARQELGVGRSSQTYQRAFDAAEAGLNQTVAAWQSGTLNVLAVGATAPPMVHTLGGNTGYDTSLVTRLNREMFLIRSTGYDGSGSSRRVIGAIARLQRIAMNVQAGLTTRGNLRIGGSSFIDGVDSTPTGWTGCAPATDTLPGILAQDSSGITTSGCGNLNCVRGDPKVLEDTTVNDSTFFKFGDLDWTELVAMATKVYGTIGGPLGGTYGPYNNIEPVGTATTCNQGAQSNWGEPGVPPVGAVLVAGCRFYFPIIYVNGSLKLTGGRGQGILLVEGNMEVQGGFEFFGPVIVRGTVTTQGTGGHFNGGLLAANVNLDQSAVLGDAVIKYSSCAIERALTFNAPGRLLNQRSWFEIAQ